MIVYRNSSLKKLVKVLFKKSTFSTQYIFFEENILNSQKETIAMLFSSEIDSLFFFYAHETSANGKNAISFKVFPKISFYGPKSINFFL
jgi:hypothetical protein